MSKKSKLIPKPLYMALGVLALISIASAGVTLLGFLGVVVGPWWWGVLQMAWEMNVWLGVFLYSFTAMTVLGVVLTALVHM